MQPVKIIDPLLVSTFSDDYKKAYLHTTTELENRSSLTAECSLSVQVTTELEDSICLVEHLQTQDLSIPANSAVQYTFPEVSYCIHYAYDKVCSIVLRLLTHFKNVIINSRHLDQQIWQF